jgi:hypothetical protein
MPENTASIGRAGVLPATLKESMSRLIFIIAGMRADIANSIRKMVRTAGLELIPR